MVALVRHSRPRNGEQTDILYLRPRRHPLTLPADRGDSAGKMGLRTPEGDPDPEGDLSPPTAAEKCVSLLVFRCNSRLMNMPYQIKDFDNSLEISCRYKGSAEETFINIDRVAKLGIPISLLIMGLLISPTRSGVVWKDIIPMVIILVLFLLSFTELIGEIVGKEILEVKEDGIAIHHQLGKIKITQQCIGRKIECVFISRQWEKNIAFRLFKLTNTGGFLGFKQGRVAINYGQYWPFGGQKTFRFGTSLTLGEAKQITAIIHERFPKYGSTLFLKYY
jgi:hypothetical protein